MAGGKRAADVLREAGATEASIAGLEDGAAIGLREGERDWEVLAWTPSGGRLPGGLTGEATEHEEGTLLAGARDRDNAAALRRLVPWLRPALLSGGPSFGFGDRLGIAGPGHVAALRAVPGLAPVLAQQSAREIGRTGRCFADVVDAATFGALAAGWRDGYAADADHLQTMAELEDGLAAGVTMFTSDPKALVPPLAAEAPRAALDEAYERVPWAALEDDRRSFESRYPDRLDLGDGALALPAERMHAAAARFGPALGLVVAMYRRLLADLGDGAFRFEVAVDEIAHPTTPADHVYIATELRRLGVRWQSFAPRFVGEFEKGIDYVGDPAAYARDLGLHARIARVFGPYKISVHSGSDKYSIYEATAEETGGLFHLKTSGTSYLAALRTLAETEPALFREVWRVASRVYAASRATYRVSAVGEALAAPEQLAGEQLVALLDDPNSREILHVTYGAVLFGERQASGDGSAAGDGSAPGDGRRSGGSGDLGAAGGDLGDAVREAVWRHRERYWAGLATHMERHLRPLTEAATSRPGSVR